MKRLVRLMGSVLLLAAALATAARAAPSACEAKSAPHRVALLELYTSEGCSSCPPADTWLRQFPAPPEGSSASILPLAFHVDYWNSIGWTDVFSDHRYTERQNALAAAAHSRLIYTPEVFVNGHEVREWSSGAVPELARQLGANAPDTDVVLEQHVDADGHYKVGATLGRLSGQHGPIALQIALYQSNLTTNVKAGENSGATLHHVFAARALSEPALFSNGHANAELDGVLPKAQSSADLGFVAFAQDQTSGEILQAVAAPACVR